ncbi:MAG: peptidoglycan DD-metalloendopeptidase family protein [Syntrophomonadaceae bacterium]|nr:peptidoglycan DD-metalloendopeptidase family protein [Syntrophomonadaceae bacterium]
MKKGHKLTAFTISLCFLITCLLPVYANEIEEHQRQLQDVSRQINQNQQIVNQKKQEEKSIMGQINVIEQNIANAENEINSLAERVAILKESIARLEEDIKLSEKKLAEKDALLSERLEYIYIEGNVSYMEVLFSATDVKDFLTRYDMLNMIVEQDIDLIEEVNKNRRDLKMKKSDLEVKEKELITIQASQEAAKEQLDIQKGEKQNVLSGVSTERKALEEALAELERASAQLETMIRQIQGGGSGEVLGTGVYTWPTPSCKSITSPYGMRNHPLLNQRKMHTGIDIGASMSASIVAADSGTVIFAGWMNAYGNTIIVDHGGGMSTLYAHQSRFSVAKGDSVVKGQEIGKVGSTGWSTGPHLHFEVRINGAYTDPNAYVR